MEKKTIELKSLDVNYKQILFILSMIGMIIFGILFGISTANDNIILLIIGIIGIIISSLLFVLMEQIITSEGMNKIQKKDLLIIILIVSFILIILILKYVFMEI